MKKIILIFIALILATLILFMLIPGGEVSANDYLRIHIRANSNGQNDQDIKFKVKEKVVDFLAPVLAECNTKDKALKALKGLTKEIENICNSELLKNGFECTARAFIKREEFPARTYEGLTLDAGVYDALIIEIGQAEGDNWWCVVYPPLCFINSKNNDGNLTYKSKLLEIIDNFNKKLKNAE